MENRNRHHHSLPLRERVCPEWQRIATLARKGWLTRLAVPQYEKGPQSPASADRGGFAFCVPKAQVPGAIGLLTIVIGRERLSPVS